MSRDNPACECASSRSIELAFTPFASGLQSTSASLSPVTGQLRVHLERAHRAAGGDAAPHGHPSCGGIRALDRAASPPCSADPARSGSIVAVDPSGNVVPGWPFVLPQPLDNFDNGGVCRESPMNPGPLFVRSPAGGGSSRKGTIVPPRDRSALRCLLRGRRTRRPEPLELRA